MPVDGNAKPPKPGTNGGGNTSKMDANAAVSGGSAREEADPVSAPSVPLPGSAATPSPSGLHGGSTADGTKPRRYRGRRRLRERKQVRARFDELCSKLERKEIDPKVAAIQVQCLNGVLGCLNAEKDEDFEKRLKAVEEKTSTDKPPRKRGADA